MGQGSERLGQHGLHAAGRRIVDVGQLLARQEYHWIAIGNIGQGQCPRSIWPNDGRLRNTPWQGEGVICKCLNQVPLRRPLVQLLLRICGVMRGAQPARGAREVSFCQSMEIVISVLFGQGLIHTLHCTVFGADI